MIRDAERIISEAAALLEGKGFSREDHYGVPEAIRDCTDEGELAEGVIAERALVNAGVDVWWSDLLCIDGDDAAATLRAVLPIDPEALYGEQHEAVLGLIRAASMLSKEQLNGISNMIHTPERRLFDEATVLAAGMHRGKLLQNVCDDVHFATAHYATTPAGVDRRLWGIRGLELVGAYYVLRDCISLETARAMIMPVAKIIFPFDQFVR
jgi:hypothetical protein